MQQLAADTEHARLGIDRDLQRPVLIALVHRVGEILAAVLDPFQRAVQELRRGDYGNVLGIDAELGAEAAADVGRGDPQALVHVEQRGQRLREIVRLLRRGVDGDAAVGGADFRDGAARLDRMRGAAVLPQLLLEHMRRLGEGRVGVAEAHLVGRNDVGVQLAAHRRAGRGFPHVGDERLDVVVDRDDGGGIFGDVAAVRHHQRHRLADVTDLAVGQCIEPRLVERHAGVRHPHHAAVGHHRRDIVEREHGVDAGQTERRLLVDAADQRVRMRTSHERDVQQAGQRDVVDEAALAAQQRLVLKAGDARADQGGHWRWYRGGAVSSPVPLRAKRVVGRGRGWGVGQIELPPTPARHSASKTRVNGCGVQR